MRLHEFDYQPVKESLHFVRPGELRGSYTDADMISMGFRRAQNGTWFIDQRRWDALIQQGKLKENAVKALEKDLKNPHSYDAIDHMMQSIAKKHGITGKELHDRFVKKHGKIPDDWIKDRVAEARIINPKQVDVYYRPVPDSRGRRVVARNIPTSTLEPLLQKLSEKYGVPVESFEWTPTEPITEAFDQPYAIQWTKQNGDWHATADLDDGSELIVLFMDQGDNSWMVEFERDENMEITGEGDAQRVFATVLTAMQQFIAKRKPARLNFSAEKEDDPTGSRARLYDRMLRRYVTGSSYDLKRSDMPGGATYTLTKQTPGVAEGLKSMYHNAVAKHHGRKADDAFDNGDEEGFKKSMDKNISHKLKAGEKIPQVRDAKKFQQGVAEGVDIGQEWMSDTELDQYVPDRLQQQWRELLGYDRNGNPSALWVNLTGGYEPDVRDPQHRALMVKVANKWFAAKKIPNVKFFDVKDADDELEWLVQIGSQDVAEGFPQPGPSSGAPTQFAPGTQIQNQQMTAQQIISSIPGVPYYNNVVDDWDAKDYSWGVTKKVIEYAEYLKQHPESLAKLPPIQVVNGKFKDGAHRVSAIWLLQQRMDPQNPLWKNAKLNVQFAQQNVEENFADGKVKGKSRPGRVKRSGASCNGSVTDLRARAKKASGERAKMYHWCANMKSGRKKNK